MDFHAAAAHIENLRKTRSLRPVAPSIEREIAFQARDLKKLQKRTASIAEAWSTVIPGPLADHSAIDRLAAGVLTVRVADASARYELDRYLREGGLERLRAAASAPITRVKIVAG